MATILIPIDGSDIAFRAIAHAGRRHFRGEKFETIIVTVLSRAESKMHHDLMKQQRDDVLNRMLAHHSVANHVRQLAAKTQVLTGEPAPMIASFALQAHCSEIIMGTRGLGVVSSVLMGSVATKVLHLVKIPVTLVQ